MKSPSLGPSGLTNIKMLGKKILRYPIVHKCNFLECLIISLEIKFMCDGIRNSPINIQFNKLKQENESSVFQAPLNFSNYEGVIYKDIENEQEHEGKVGLANIGGRTAVS